MKRPDELTLTAVILLVLAVAIALVGHLATYGHLDPGQFARDYYVDLSLEFAGITLTVLLIDRLNRRRDARMAADRQRTQLIRDLGSSVHAVAARAAEELRQHGLLEDGTLRGTDLSRADLRGAPLNRAHLRRAVLNRAQLDEAALSRAMLGRASLVRASLRGAVLNMAVLDDANLTGADLSGADLNLASIERAILCRADLRGADLRYASLKGADLSDALLGGANLHEAHMDAQTVLPDGTRWTPEIDLNHLTRPTPRSTPRQ